MPIETKLTKEKSDRLLSIDIPREAIDRLLLRIGHVKSRMSLISSGPQPVELGMEQTMENGERKIIPIEVVTNPQTGEQSFHACIPEGASYDVRIITPDLRGPWKDQPSERLLEIPGLPNVQRQKRNMFGAILSNERRDSFPQTPWKEMTSAVDTGVVLEAKVSRHKSAETKLFAVIFKGEQTAELSESETIVTLHRGIIQGRLHGVVLPQRNVRVPSQPNELQREIIETLPRHAIAAFEIQLDEPNPVDYSA